jgi:2-amino-4-hydroxy-6-hydroxymethyldihydropteridine diphosphokinase
MTKTSYAIALGSNRRHGRHGAPAAVLRAAFDALDHGKLRIDAASPIIATAAVGPAGRGFANAAAIVTTKLDPPALLDRLKRIEVKFGRRGGRRWGARVLDLDIILWSGGIHADARLAIPHPAFRARRFVLDPLAAVAAEWRDPVSGLAVRHLLFRARRRPPVVDRPRVPA